MDMRVRGVVAIVMLLWKFLRKVSVTEVSELMAVICSEMILK